MARSIARYASPARWRRFIAGKIEVLRRNWADQLLDATWRDLGPVQFKAAPKRVIADGMWRNPGYFLRLRLVISALSQMSEHTLFGVLQNAQQWRERRAMERIGFTDFVYINDDREFRAARFSDKARKLLAGVRTHNDFLRIALPHEFPAYFWYDSVLKNTRHGRPPIDHPEWHKSLCETLAYLEIYDRVLQEQPVSHVLLSHAWNCEWVALAWLALRRGIPTLLVTAYSDAIRIRRFCTIEDLRLPMEFLPRHQFDALAPVVRQAIVNYGRQQLSVRQKSETLDINIRYAYLPGQRTTDRQEARRSLGIADDRPLGIVYGHSWFDFPHLYGMRNFTDFVDWFEVTLKEITKLDHVVWLLKPHPMEEWYGGYKMSEGLGTLPSHVRLLSRHVDTLTAMSAADAIVTVHGTAAMEASALGVPVIAADRSYFEDWGFAHSAGSRDDYLSLLSRVGRLPRLSADERDLAYACFALTYAVPNAESHALNVPCDSLGSDLYDLVRAMVVADPQALSAEVTRIAEFLAQDRVDSFEAFGIVRWASGALADAAA